MAKKSEHRDLFPGALENMILPSLRHKPCMAMTWFKHIKRGSDDLLLQVEVGSLNPALQRILKEGRLEAQSGISAKGRPTRIDRLTAEGIRHIESEVVSFERMFRGFNRVLAAAKA
jgi:PadR family transcriptional regulator PadR